MRNVGAQGDASQVLQVDRQGCGDVVFHKIRTVSARSLSGEYVRGIRECGRKMSDVFDGLPTQNVLTCYAFLNAYAEHGHGHLACKVESLRERRCGSSEEARKGVHRSGTQDARVHCRTGKGSCCLQGKKSELQFTDKTWCSGQCLSWRNKMLYVDAPRHNAFGLRSVEHSRATLPVTKNFRMCNDCCNSTKLRSHLEHRSQMPIVCTVSEMATVCVKSGTDRPRCRMCQVQWSV